MSIAQRALELTAEVAEVPAEFTEENINSASSAKPSAPSAFNQAFGNIFLDGLFIGCYKHVVDWRDYWAKAKENLEMALLAYQRKRHNVCASRAYYAVFLASIAALIKLTELRPRDNEWDHGQVQAELNRRLIMRRKILPAELGRTPMDLMELRHLADYKPQSVSAAEAKRAYDRAGKFLAAIGKALKEST